MFLSQLVHFLQTANMYTCSYTPHWHWQLVTLERTVQVCCIHTWDCTIVHVCTLFGRQHHTIHCSLTSLACRDFSIASSPRSAPLGYVQWIHTNTHITRIPWLKLHSLPQVINEFVITRLYCKYVHEIQGTIHLTHTMEITVVGSFDDGLHCQAVVGAGKTLCISHNDRLTCENQLSHTLSTYTGYKYAQTHNCHNNRILTINSTA